MVQPLNIYPSIGIGDVRLGMSPKTVAARMGEPQAHEHWMGGNLNDALVFRGLRFHFDTFNAAGPLPDSLLNLIVIHGRDDTHLFGRPPWNWTKTTLLAHLATQGSRMREQPSGDVETAGMAMSFDATDALDWIEIAATSAWRMSWTLKQSPQPLRSMFSSFSSGGPTGGIIEIASATDIVQHLTAMQKIDGTLTLDTSALHPLGKSLHIQNCGEAYLITVSEETETDYEVRSFNGNKRLTHTIEIGGYRWPAAQVCFDSAQVLSVVRSFLATGDVDRTLFS